MGSSSYPLCTKTRNIDTRVKRAGASYEHGVFQCASVQCVCKLKVRGALPIMAKTGRLPGGGSALKGCLFQVSVRYIRG